jgi:hypothetical protein
MLRASENRAPPHGGEASGGRFSSASDDDGGGFQARLREQLPKGRASEIADPERASRAERASRSQDRAPLSWTNERADMLLVRVREEGSGFAMFAPPICKRRWRNNAFPFRQIRRRRRQPSEHRSEPSEQSKRARSSRAERAIRHCAISPQTRALRGARRSRVRGLAVAAPDR